MSNIGKTYDTSSTGLKKRCGCARSKWNKCEHSFVFNFTWKKRLHRGSLGLAKRDEADIKFAAIVAAIKAGTYAEPATTNEQATTIAPITVAMAAAEYAKDDEGLARLSAASKRQHRYAQAFLTTVVVPPGVPLSEKPVADVIRADIKLAIKAKETPTEQTFRKGQRTWTRTVGGKIAANRLHDYLRSFWNWMIEQGYVATSPFIRTRKGKNKLKHDEIHRERRLREGEEAALLKHANPHLRDVIVAALETGMRVGELLSLVWSQVRLTSQNEIYLPAGKTKARRARKIPISATLHDILTRRQYGETAGPNPQRFKFGSDHYVFGNEVGGQIKAIKTAWENTVLKAHGVSPERSRGGRLSASCRSKLDEINLHVHDLRHEAGSRKLEAGWPLHAVSAFLGHANITTTSRYLNVTDDYLQDLIERKPLTLVKG